MKVLVIDNYDSFTFNLVHYLQIAGAEVDVKLNDDPFFDKPIAGYQGLVLSPGPNEPMQSGKLMECIALNIGNIPMLGVCLGMQALALYYGGTVKQAPIPVHGKQSIIKHTNSSLFKGIEPLFGVGRYHSLMVSNLPNKVAVTATFQGVPMAMQYQPDLVQAVQFHPESILTPAGQKLMDNWVASLT